MRILHTADWHIRDRQYGRGFRGQDFADRCHEVVDIAIERKVDCIINGGDTFHINRPSGPMQAVLFDIHQRLREANIPMFTVTGNHDASDPSYLKFPGYGYGEGAALCGVVCIDNRMVECGGLLIAGYPAAVETEDLIKSVKATKPDIVVWHGAVREFVPFDMDKAISVADFPAGPKAWLLGDIHLAGKQRDPHGALVSYPGTIETVSRGEPKDKFVDIYDVTPGQPFPDEPLKIRLDTRPAVFLSVATGAEADQAVEKVRETVRLSPSRGPLVFLRHHKTCRDVVPRISEILDPKDSVFLHASFHTDFEGVVGRKEIDVLRPDLLACVDEIMPPGAKLNKICRALASREIQARGVLAEWVDQELGEKITTNEK